jgi:uncharacterized YigZ family protein
MRFTPKNEVVTEYKEKGSKFIAYVFPVENEMQCKKILGELKKNNPKANHVCYAYVLLKDEFMRYSDDGEPSNTAGLPILNQIKSGSLSNILLVVVRYFGGTKLGVGGLIKAYKESAKLCLSVVEKEELIDYHMREIQCNYETLGSVLQLIENNEGIIEKRELTYNCVLEVLIPIQYIDTFDENINKLIY